MDLRETGCENGRQIKLAQDRVQWRPLALATLNFPVLLSEGQLIILLFYAIAMGWTTGVSIPGRGSDGIFPFATAFRPALRLIQPPPIQWVLGALNPGIKRPRREADHSPPSSAEVKNVFSYTYALPIRLHGVVLS